MASPSVGSASSAPSGVSPSASPAPTRARTPAAKPPNQPAPAMLPRGGREIFPRYRLVGYAGVTGASALGRLGTGPLNQRVAEIERRAKPYAAGREILPVVEVIATVVQGSSGRDGKYRVRLSDAQIAKYHKAARKHRAVLLLNLQPGRSEFITEAKAFRKWLKEPDVGVALDPEWAMDRGQRPGGVFGHTTGAELDEVSRYLSGLVKQYNLPQKVMVYHQVARSVIRQGVRAQTTRRRSRDQVRGRTRASRAQEEHLSGGQQVDTQVRARRLQAVLHRGSAPRWPAHDATGGAPFEAATRVRHVRIALAHDH